MNTGVTTTHTPLETSLPNDLNQVFTKDEYARVFQDRKECIYE